MTTGNGYHFVDLEKGKFAQTTRQDLRRFFQDLRSDGSRGLVVHFHGGLVSREAAHRSARRLSTAYDVAGVESLFFIWNTDLGTTLRKNLPAIAREAIFWTVVSRVRALVTWAGTEIPKAVAGTRSGRASRPPPVLPPNETAKQVRAKAAESDPEIVPRQFTARDETQALQALENDGALRKRFSELAPPEPGARGGRGGAVHKRTLMSSDLLKQAYPRSLRGSRAGVFVTFLLKRVLAAAGAVMKRYVKRTHHGLYPTVVEEVLNAFYAANIGRGIWSAMKNNSVEAFDGAERLYAGAAFVVELNNWWDPDKRVTFVGHSAGSIFIVELMQRLMAVNPRFRANCVLLAPACSFERFAQGLPDLRKGLSALRVFNLSDELERGYWEVPVLYNASLLYLVSGILEDEPDTPLIGMQRYYAGQKPYTRPEILSVSQFLQPALNWAPATVPPARLCNATQHGGFDADKDTLASLASIAKDGIR